MRHLSFIYIYIYASVLLPRGFLFVSLRKVKRGITTGRALKHWAFIREQQNPDGRVASARYGHSKRGKAAAKSSQELAKSQSATTIPLRGNGRCEVRAFSSFMGCVGLMIAAAFSIRIPSFAAQKGAISPLSQRCGA